VPAANLFGGFSSRMAAVEARLRGHVWPMIAVVATLAIAANGGRVGSALWMDARFDPKRMPVDAVNFLAQQRLEGPVLSTDSWGGYLIYRLYPQTQVVVDDRHDLYGEEFFKSYLKMVRVETGWEQFLSEHKNSCLLLPRGSALASVVAENRGWKKVYADDVSVIFVREPNRR
jgi:hypothetical protein